MATLSLGMIVKNEGDTIERVLGCARVVCDEMIVVDTGSTDDTVAKAEAMGAKVYHFVWIHDFAAARNFAFSHCTKDWVMWLDGDDIITPENQRHILEIKTNELNDTIDATYLRYDCAPFTMIRERMIRRALFGTTLQWKNAVHEGIHGIDLNRAKFFRDVSITHDTPPNRYLSKEGRNIGILRRQYESGNRDPFMLFMYATECMHVDIPEEERQQALKDFFASNPAISQRYEIYLRIYDIYQKQNSERALEAAAKALSLDPKRAEAYCRLASHHLVTCNDPWAAIPLLAVATQLSQPNYGLLETASYGYKPWAMLTKCYFVTEDLDKAKYMAEKTLLFNPPNAEWFGELLTYDTHSEYPSLPADWHKWFTENFIIGNVAAHVLLREMADCHFSPGATLQCLAAARSKKETST